MHNAFCPKGGLLLACVLGCSASQCFPYQTVYLWVLELSTVQPVLSRPGCNSSEQSDAEKCLISLLHCSDFCKSMSGFHYHVIAVGHKIALENSSDQSSVLEMLYCYILECVSVLANQLRRRFVCT